MIRFSKILFTNPAQINISGIKCNYDNIIKIVNIFSCEWIVLTIDSVIEKSSLLTFIEHQRLKHFIKKDITNNIEVTVIVPYKLFDYVMEKVINEDPENIFMFNLLNPRRWNEQLNCCFETLVATGITNMAVFICLDENALQISINKFLLSPKDMYKKIKALRLE